MSEEKSRALTVPPADGASRSQVVPVRRDDRPNRLAAALILGQKLPPAVAARHPLLARFIEAPVQVIGPGESAESIALGARIRETMWQLLLHEYGGRRSINVNVTAAENSNVVVNIEDK